jgi:hypothetical protein
VTRVKKCHYKAVESLTYRHQVRHSGALRFDFVQVLIGLRPQFVVRVELEQLKMDEQIA